MLPGSCHLLLLCQGSGTHVRSLCRLLRGLQQGPARLKGISSSDVLSPGESTSSDTWRISSRHRCPSRKSCQILAVWSLVLHCMRLCAEECDDCLVAMKCVAARLPPVPALSIRRNTKCHKHLSVSSMTSLCEFASQRPQHPVALE